MTSEARVAFVLFFFAVWCFMGLIPWAIAAVVAHGRGALAALPIALAGACASGAAVPLIGFDNFRGFLVSLITALLAATVGSVVGSRVAQRLWPLPSAGERHPRGRAREVEAEGSHPPPRT